MLVHVEICSIVILSTALWKQAEPHYYLKPTARAGLFSLSGENLNSKSPTYDLEIGLPPTVI